MTTPNTAISNNWSGAQILAPAGQSLNTVSGQWTVPTVSQVPNNATGISELASWVGLDGSSGSTDVCQAGVQANVTTSATGQTAVRYYAWDEWVPNVENQLSPSVFKINPGDTINISVETAGAGATQATFLFNDKTDAQTYQDTVRAPTGVSLVGNVAEWVAEAPTETVGSTTFQPQLANYGGAPVLFSDASATYAGGATASLAAAEDINMVSSGMFGLPNGITTAYGSVLPGTDSILSTEADYWSTSANPLFSNEMYY